MSRRLWVWPVYCRIRVPLRESMRRTMPSSPAVKRRCGILGCQTILTTPAGCSKDCRSTWWTTSQKLIRPCRVPVTTRLKVASGQKDTASTEFSSSSFEDPGWQDNVVNNWIITKEISIILYLHTSIFYTLPVWVLYSLAVESSEPVTISVLSRWQSMEETALVCAFPLFMCCSTASVFRSNTFADPSTYPTASRRPKLVIN